MLCFAVFLITITFASLFAIGMTVLYIIENGPGVYSSTILYIRNKGRQWKQQSSARQQREVHVTAEPDRARMMDELRLFFDQPGTADEVIERKSWLLGTIEEMNDERTGSYQLGWKSK